MEHSNHNNTQEVVIKVNIPMASAHVDSSGHQQHDYDHHNDHHDDHHNDHHQAQQQHQDAPQREDTMEEIISQRRKSIHEEVDALHGNVHFNQRSETLKDKLNLEHQPHQAAADATFEDTREDEMQQLQEQQTVTSVLESEVYRDHLENSMAQHHEEEGAQRRSSRPSSSSSVASKKSEHLLITNGSMDKPPSTRGSASNSRENTMSKIPITQQPHHDEFQHHHDESQPHHDESQPHHDESQPYHDESQPHHDESLHSNHTTPVEGAAVPETRTSQTVEHKFYKAAVTNYEDPLKETSPRPTSTYETSPMAPNMKGDNFANHPSASTSAAARNSNKKQKSSSCSIL